VAAPQAAPAEGADVTEEEEPIWERGRRTAYARLLDLCLANLDDPEMADKIRAGRLLSEREAAVVALRSLCEDFGDNDWPASLHLEDVIEKHLGRHLYADPPKEPKP
jgi:hypothetical protein